MIQNMVYLGKCTVWTWAKCVTAAIEKSSLYISIISSWVMVPLSSTTPFLFCLLDLSIINRRVPTILVDSSFPSSSYVSFWLIFWCSVVRHITLMENHLLYHYLMPLFTMIIFFSLKSVHYEVDIDTPAFFCLVLAWYVFFYSFTFNLYLSLYLK